jgi:DNA invertase Pin-like site-specific DNA recombinase
MLLEATENSKRVYGLYRVSTLGQVEKDDIPMQKQCCREFCQRQAGWKIVKEFSEKGVSGFKVSAKDRDAIQEIQRDALAGKFDILLVFIFDRLGRRDDETPFVVEWFVKNGIEVWSAMEGQQRFDNHVDKLLNYIRYWQASGESIKTSMRVKTRMEQLTQEGHYTGGGVPYGYRLEQQGRINKKNRSVYDLAVDEAEAEIVKLIFEKYVFEGYGAYRLCKYLVELGIRGRKGSNIPTTSINRILKNQIYTGVICNGDCKSDLIPELQIIDEDLFQRAQKIMEKRTTHHSDVPLNTRGQSLLVGNVFCGHCGGRLTLTTSGRKRVRKDGTLNRETRARYQCHYNVRHPGECDGQSGYGVTKLDGIVNQIVHIQFGRIKNEPPQDLIERQNAKEIGIAKSKLKLAQEQLNHKQDEYETLRAETVKVLQGKSRLNVDLLNSLVEETKKAIEILESQVQTAQAELQERLDSTETVRQEYAQLVSWADMYDHCTFEAKKMILAQFIKAVYVRRDYEIEIEFNVSFEEFQNLYLAKDGVAVISE